jgi:hypothetical protein
VVADASGRIKRRCFGDAELAAVALRPGERIILGVANRHDYVTAAGEIAPRLAVSCQVVAAPGVTTVTWAAAPADPLPVWVDGVRHEIPLEGGAAVLELATEGTWWVWIDEPGYYSDRLAAVVA